MMLYHTHSRDLFYTRTTLRAFDLFIPYSKVGVPFSNLLMRHRYYDKNPSLFYFILFILLDGWLPLFEKPSTKDPCPDMVAEARQLEIGLLSLADWFKNVLLKIAFHAMMNKSRQPSLQSSSFNHQFVGLPCLPGRYFAQALPLDCWKYFHKTLNTAPCTLLVSKRVWRPRPNSPVRPSFSMICWTTRA